jgi:hypothetical protein
MKIFLPLLIAVSMGGCLSYHRGDFAAISTRAIPSKMKIIESHVEGRSCKPNWEPRFQLAVEDALEKVPQANALVSASYRLEKLCIVVSGTAVRIVD